MKKILITLFAFLGLVFLASCSGETTSGDKTRVRVYFQDTNNSSIYPTKYLFTGDTVEKPDNPNKSGYTFKYWANGDEEYDFTKKLESDVTLKAIWEANSYIITLDKDGGEGDVVETINVTYNSSFTLPSGSALSKTGYEFVGWFLNNFEVTSPNTYLYTSNITLKATWRPNTYVLSYETDNGTLNAYEQLMTYNELYVLTTPEKKGYEFIGWFDEDNNQITNGVWTRLAPLTIYAHYRKLSYSLTIKYQDVLGDTIKDDDVHNLYYGDHYNYDVEEIPGYLPNYETITGYMDNYNRTIVITYGTPRTLTINYFLLGDAIATPAYVKTLGEGSNYYVQVPFIDNYATNITYVEGVIGSEDVTVNVYYLNVWDGTSRSPYTVGSMGTENAPYIIETADQLYYLAKQVNENGQTYANTYFMLNADINLSGKPWSPIGGALNTHFDGIFSGAGHTIYGYKITEDSGLFHNVNATTYGYLGLFGKLGNNAVVRDLTISNYSISVDYNNIENSNRSQFRAGGLAGMVTDRATIINVATIGSNINIHSKNGLAYGGIIGEAKNTTISNSYHIGSATLNNNSTSALIGGILGSGQSITLSNIYSRGQLNITSKGETFVGGLVGSCLRSRLQYGYSTMSITANINSSTLESHIAGIIAQGTDYIISKQSCFYEGNIIVNATHEEMIHAGFIDTKGAQLECYYLDNSALIINDVRSEYLKSTRITNEAIRSNIMEFGIYVDDNNLIDYPNAVWVLGEYPTLYWQ